MQLEIDGGYSGIRFSACHFIPNHEKCSRLHGHSYIVRLRVEGDPDENGMIMDFVILKNFLRSMIDKFDHRTLLPAKSPEVGIMISGNSVEVNSGTKRYVFPREDTVMLDIASTTAEEMSRMMVKQMVSEISFPPNVKRVSIGLDEERGQTAWYTEVFE